MKDQTDDYWKDKLTPEQYHVLREKGTEAPFTGELLNNHKDGVYNCVACGQELFSSDTKFDSGSGWPSFSNPVNRQNIELKEDVSHGLRRVEVTCAHCGAHLGHVFEDGPMDMGGDRYCINSVCLAFTPTTKS